MGSTRGGSTAMESALDVLLGHSAAGLVRNMHKHKNSAWVADAVIWRAMPRSRYLHAAREGHGGCGWWRGYSHSGCKRWAWILVQHWLMIDARAVMSHGDTSHHRYSQLSSAKVITGNHGRQLMLQWILLEEITVSNCRDVIEKPISRNPQRYQLISGNH